MLRPACLAALLVVAAAPPLAAATFEGTIQADSTFVAHWRLANGLDVVAHHVPGADRLTATLAVRAGHGDDPADLPGLDELMAYAWYLGAAGDTPERKLRDLPRLRPEGWNLRVTREAAVFSEVTRSGGLAGILAGFGDRMARPALTETALGAAREAAREAAASRWFGEPAVTLHHRGRAFAEGIPDAELVARSELRALKGLKASDLSARFASTYVPANAALAINGDLDGVDVRGMVQAVFGEIPAGTRRPLPPPAPFKPGSREARAPHFPRSAAVVAVTTPAPDDSLHPSFLLNMLLLGSAMQQGWGRPEVVNTRFSFAVLEEPDLVRLYPPVPENGTPKDAVDALEQRLDELGALLVTGDDLEAARSHFRWLVGGPMPGVVVERMRHDPGSAVQLGINEALRTLGRGTEFWATYLDRFDRNDRDPRSWIPWLVDPAHRATLVLSPPR